MSMNFNEDVSAKHQQFIKELMGDDLVAIDQRTALFESKLIEQKLMKEVANKTGQPVCVEINDEGDIKTMADGTKYKATPQGWKKLAL